MVEGQNKNKHRSLMIKKRPTIGFFINELGGNYHFPEWLGANDVALEQGVSMFCFVGRVLHSEDPVQLAANIIYDLAQPAVLDGLIISASLMASTNDYRFFDRYRSFPLVSISMELEGVPSIETDNEKGFRDLLIHLIRDHGYRRLAYIGGPQGNFDADQRYQVYQKVLMEHSIPLNPDLIAYGRFRSTDSGIEAIQLFIDQRKAQFDAVVAANDTMAMGVISELKTREIEVPNDIAVTGFDDQYQTRYLIPPLTTVRQLAYQHGRSAMEVVLALLHGDSVPNQIFLPTELVIRNSCGCFSKSVTRAALEGVKIEEEPDKPDQELLNAWRKLVLPKMLQALGFDYPAVKLDWIDQLIYTFLADIQNGSNNAFLKALNMMLLESAKLNLELTSWQNVITAMQQFGLSYFEDKVIVFKAENLWHQARVMLGEIAERAEASHSYKILEQLFALSRIRIGIDTTLNLQQLATALFIQLTEFEVANGFLALYEGDNYPSEWSRLILAFNEKERIAIDPGGLRFPTEQIIPESIFPGDKQISLGVFPLYFGAEQLGFIAFDVIPVETRMYETLRGAISSALKGALLVEKLKEKEQLLEERASALTNVNNELEQIAYATSHDLIEPLRMVIGYLQLIERRYEGKLDVDADEFIGFAVDGANRMYNLINDLLLYAQVGKQGKPFERVDLKVIMDQVLLNLKITIEEHHARIIQGPMPVVMADPGQMLQLLQNLIGNAIKFHDDTPPEAHVNAERQSDGWLFTVRDNGIGLDIDHAERIFLIFQRLHSKDEYPGTGIGLSICKKIVEHHGGKIWVESEPGEGAIFYFTIRTDSR